MKKLALSIFLLVSLLMTSPLHAVTYPFPESGPAYLKEDGVLKAGTRVYLFQSGTEEVKNAISVNDILSVYREYPSDFSLEVRETGKVRITAVPGEYYYEAVVIAGTVQPGFLAKAGTVACFITSFRKGDNPNPQ
jgi:hypothetical protein